MGGLLFQLTHTLPFLVDAASYLVSVISLRRIRTDFQEARTVSQGSLRIEIAEGIRWLWHQPLIRFMAFVTGGSNLVNSGGVLIVIVIARQQHAPTAAIGAIFSIGSIGGLAGAAVAPLIQRRFGFGRVITTTTWWTALLWPMYALAPNAVVLGVVTAGLYLGGPIYNAVQFGYRVSIIPDALQGRVNSVFRLIAFGFSPLGTAMAGILLQSVGSTETVMIYSAITLGIALATTLNPRVRNARPVVETQRPG